MHLDYDKLTSEQTIKSKSLQPGLIEEVIEARPSTGWTTNAQQDALAATISGSAHNHVLSNAIAYVHSGVTLNASGLTVGSSRNTSGYMALTEKDTLTISGSDGSPVVEFDLIKGTVDINQLANIQVAAEIFWHAIAQSYSSLIPRSEYHRVNNSNAELREQLSRTQALLEKSLKALGDKYNEELILSEDVEF